MTNKTTIRSQFVEIRDVLAACGRNDLAEFMDGRIAQMSKKSPSVKKPTPKQVENAGIKDAIIEWMDYDVEYTSKSVAENCPACAELTTNRVAALLSQLGKAGQLDVKDEKHTKVYTLA